MICTGNVGLDFLCNVVRQFKLRNKVSDQNSRRGGTSRTKYKSNDHEFPRSQIAAIFVAKIICVQGEKKFFTLRLQLEMFSNAECKSLYFSGPKIALILTNPSLKTANLDISFVKIRPG